MNLEKAARQIVLARDCHAESGAYPAPPLGPDPSSQCFDDWASDLLHAALTSEATLRDREGRSRGDGRCAMTPRGAQIASLLHAVHQRVDNAGDMGCPQVTVADAVSYWVVRFAHDQDAASELADAWDDGVGEEYPGVANPWRDYAPTPIHGTSPDAANAINRLRDIAARHREV